MKRALIIIVVVFLLLLAGCNPVAEEIETSPPPEVETPKPLASPSPLPLMRTAEEVLPPVGKNIFSNEWTDNYGFSISADPDGCAAILSDGSLVAFGSTAAGGSLELDENGYYRVSNIYNNITHVSCSQFDSFAIDEDGTLLGWGMVRWWGNIIHATDVDEPLRLMTDVQMASAGGGSYLALREDGTVWMWGSGEYGVLGNGQEYTKYSSADPLLDPVKVLEDVIWAEMSGGRCYAIDKHNTLWTWGYMGESPETNEAVFYDRPVCIMEDVKYVGGVLAVKTDGTLWALELNGDGGVESVQIMEGVKFARGGTRFTVIKDDGSLWVWGDNTGGALGNGTDEYVDKPMKIMDDVVNVTSDEGHLYALKSNGELWEMGAPYGMLHYSSDVENAPTKEEFFYNCLPHKILDGVLVRRAS